MRWFIRNLFNANQIVQNMSKSHTIFLPYHIMGRNPVTVIKYDSGKFTTKTYKSVFDMPADLRHEYWCQRVARHMSHNK